MPKPTLIATLPPYVEHRSAIIGHPLVDELRFNSISPLAEPKPDLLDRLRAECGAKKLWIDLKGRQLRITKFAFLPYAYVEINHRIHVNVPTDLWFQDGLARIEAVVDGYKLILSNRPWRVLGDGEPVNILDPSLEITDPLPERDREFIRAARRLGLHHYMLSFVEGQEDLERVYELDPQAQVIAKIESQRGLKSVRSLAEERVRGKRRKVRLMAARDDLYVHMGPDKTGILAALQAIITTDPTAIVASKILESLVDQDTVNLADLSDLRLMETFGYRSFLLGDGPCFREEVFNRVMAVLEAYFRKDEG